MGTSFCIKSTCLMLQWALGGGTRTQSYIRKIVEVYQWIKKDNVIVISKWSCLIRKSYITRKENCQANKWLMNITITPQIGVKEASKILIHLLDHREWSYICTRWKQRVTCTINLWISSKAINWAWLWFYPHHRQPLHHQQYLSLQ